VSFTGSTRAGVLVAKAAADTIKRVHQELGGKSPNVILPDADFARAIPHAVNTCFRNSGQSCNAPTRLLVPADRRDEVVTLAKQQAERAIVGMPGDEATTLGPVVNRVQFDKIQALIQRGIDEGATLVIGGPGRPQGFDRGYFVRPTVFTDVTRDMTIAREEIFGPVLCIQAYRDEDEAVDIANDTDYGLSSYVYSGDLERARRVARRIRAGMVHLNGAPADYAGAFTGYKHSGNGQEWGRYGFEAFLEVKTLFGYDPRPA
jgi:aldehyde dehydrogenase (NAD+)